MSNQAQARFFERDNEYVLEVAFPVGDEETLMNPESNPDNDEPETIPHPRRGEVFDENGNPFDLRVFTFPKGDDPDGDEAERAEQYLREQAQGVLNPAPPEQKPDFRPL